ECRRERPVERRQLVDGHAPQGNRPTATVPPVTAVVEVVLDAQEGVEHLRPTPPRASELTGPALVVVDRAADRTESIDRRRATRAAAAHVQLLGSSRGAGRDEVGPNAVRLGESAKEVR